MNVYPIHITSEITLDILKKNLFIFIFRASKIPPHIGIITNGKLFDITSVGPNLGLNVEDFYKTILKRKSEVVFIELDKKNINQNLIEQVITDQVNHFWKVTLDVSCLTPIKGFLEKIFNADVKQAHFIFDLLPILYEKGLILNASQLNLDKKIINQNFLINKYSKKDVENCINALSRKEVAC